MRFLGQILRETGADTDGAITLIPAFGAYFKRVKRVEEYSDEKIVLISDKRRWRVVGDGLSIGKYFEQDLLLFGNVTGIELVGDTKRKNDGGADGR